MGLRDHIVGMFRGPEPEEILGLSASDSRHPELVASVAARLAYEHISPENQTPHVEQAANLAAKLALRLLTPEMHADNSVRFKNGGV